MADSSNDDSVEAAYTGQPGVRYQVYAPSAPCGGQYDRRANIYVIGFDQKSEARFCNIKSKCIVYRKALALNIDSRCQGPKSGYGRFYQAAEELAKKLNVESRAAEYELVNQAA